MKKIILIGAVLFSGLLSAQTWNPTSATYLATTTFSLNHVAISGSPLFTATNGKIRIKNCSIALTAAAVGLTSVSIQTNDGTVTTILASTILASLGVAGTPLTPFTTIIQLASTKAITATIVGDGTAGSLDVACEWQPITPGATFVAN